MRADDIRRMVLDTSAKAVAECDRLLGTVGVDATEVERYREVVEEVAEFWRSASPGFIHAWFEAQVEALP